MAQGDRLDQSHLRSLFRAIPEPCAILAPDPPSFTILDANQSYLSTAQIQRDELVGRGFFEVFPSREREPEGTNLAELRDSLNKVLETKRVHSLGAFRYDLTSPDPSTDRSPERYWSVRNIPVLTEDGQVCCVLHRVEQITELIVKEPQPSADHGQSGPKSVLVAEEDAEMRGYLARMCQTNWQVRSVSDGEAALAELRENPPDLLLASQSLPLVGGEALLEFVREHGELAGLSVILLGTHVDEAARYRGMRAGADDYISQPDSPREVIARIQAQIARAELRDWLEEKTRRRFFDLFMKAPAFIAVMEGPEHRYVLSNPAHRRLTGRGDVVGSTVAEVYPEHSHHDLFGVLDDVYQTGEPFSAEAIGFDFVDPSSGESAQKHLTFVYLPTYDLEGRVDGVAVFGWDVTEMVEARQQLQQQAEALREESRLKDEFLAMLGHELRNPLTPLMTIGEILKADGGLDAEQIDWAAGIIDRQVGQLTNLVDDLLDVARISEGRIELDLRMCPLDEVLAGAVESVEPMVERRDQHLEVDLPDAPVSIQVDPTRLTQVVSNLLHNATKYTPEGGDIRLFGEITDDDLSLVVEDTGRGIDADLLPHVFDLFRQADRSLDRPEGGLGLGLTLVRRLVEMHGGTVSALSEGAGKGSRFVVHLPGVVCPHRS